MQLTEGTRQQKVVVHPSCSKMTMTRESLNIAENTMLNNVDVSTHPCLTPCLTWKGSEVLPSSIARAKYAMIMELTHHKEFLRTANTGLDVREAFLFDRVECRYQVDESGVGIISVVHLLLRKPHYALSGSIPWFRQATRRLTRIREIVLPSYGQQGDTPLVVTYKTVTLLVRRTIDASLYSGGSPHSTCVDRVMLASLLDRVR
jgi:hypothetical protein